MTNSIKANNITVQFGNQLALQNVSFDIQGPKVVGLLGKNGAGKTTLLSLLASFREPSSGQIMIDGEEAFENATAMQKVAFIYDKDWKEEDEKIKEILKLVERYRPNFDRDYAMELIEKFQLPTNKPIKKFSKGMQSKLNAVIGLSGRTPITFFDETYQGMDAESRDTFYRELLADQERHPRLIILSTHLVSEMDYLFDEVLIINNGKLLLQENYEDLITQGASIVGEKEKVDRFTSGMQILNEQSLGNTKSVMVFGALSESMQLEAELQGLEVGPVSLQDLFIHLTKEDR